MALPCADLEGVYAESGVAISELVAPHGDVPRAVQVALAHGLGGQTERSRHVLQNGLCHKQGLHVACTQSPEQHAQVAQELPQRQGPQLWA